MRVVIAAMFVVVAVFVAVVGLDHFSLIVPLKWMGLVSGVVFFIVLLVALRLLSPPAPRRQTIADMESRGLIVDQSFKAIRVFQAEEIEDEGPQYFIELDDGSILFLVGQYLYDYGLSDDDTEVNQPHMFPCSEFTIRRHKEKGYVVEIRCGGKGLKPEVCVPPLRGKNLDDYCEDGMIIRGKSYDALKAQLTKGDGADLRRAGRII